MFDIFKLIFLLFAFTFDLYKWCVFIAATGTVQNKELLEVRTKTLTITLVVIQISIFTVFTTFIVGVYTAGNPSPNPTPEYNKWMHYEHILNMTTFFVFLVLYVCVLILLTNRLKKSYP